jgi:hypothetical protein
MKRQNKVKYILYPENSKKANWDIFMTLILILTCIITPLRLAFGEEEEPLGWVIFMYSIDFMFLIDILVIFNTAYYDEYL